MVGCMPASFDVCQMYIINIITKKKCIAHANLQVDQVVVQ